ncbi:MAG: hypothetical protein V4519_04105 [Patescibacteria group bacterium]
MKLTSNIYNKVIKSIVGLVLFLAFFIVCAYSYDPDLGWHIKSGQYIVENGIPTYDIFSYSASSFEWINHEWLYSVLISQLHALGGELLLSLVIAGLWTAGILLASRKYEPLILIAAGISIISFAGIRPSVFALLFFVLLERILEKISTQTNKLPFLISLILLFLVWANIHASFPLGFVVLIIFACSHKKTIPWYIYATCILASFVNPYGPHIYVEIFRTLTSNDLRAYVSEWQGYIIPITYFFTILPLLLMYVFGKKKAIFDRKYLFSCILFCASIVSTRFFLFFTAYSLRYLEDYFIKFRSYIRSKVSNVSFVYTYVLIGCSIFFVGLTERVSHGQYYPVQAVAYLQQNACPGNLFNFYDYGGYLIWKLPSHKVFIDGRMPTWRTDTENYMADYVRAIHDTEFRKTLFDTHTIKCVLFPHTATNLISDLKTQGWNVLIADSTSILLIQQ